MSTNRVERDGMGRGWRVLALALVLGIAAPSLSANPPDPPGGSGSSAATDDDRPVGSLPILQNGPRRPRAGTPFELPGGIGVPTPTWGPWHRTPVAFPSAGGEFIALGRSGDVLLGPLWVPEGIVVLELPWAPAYVVQFRDDGLVEVFAGPGLF